jgi:hypothetical protein
VTAGAYLLDLMCVLRGVFTIFSGASLLLCMATCLLAAGDRITGSDPRVALVPFVPLASYPVEPRSFGHAFCLA